MPTRRRRNPRSQPASQQPALPRVTVFGTQIPEATTASRPSTRWDRSVRPKILDAPYSISVLPLDLIENSQAMNFKDVSKYLPLVAYQEQQGPDILRPQTRGMQGGNFQNSRMDGMTMYVTVANAMEQFQQIEVLNGVSASLYGPANPSGMFNFVSKRPTDDDLRRRQRQLCQRQPSAPRTSIWAARIDPATASSATASTRLSATATASSTAVISGACSAISASTSGPWQDTVVELNYSDYHLINNGYPGWFTYGEKVALPLGARSRRGWATGRPMPAWTWRRAWAACG